MIDKKLAIKFEISIERIRLELPTLSLVADKLSNLLQKNKDDGDQVISMIELEALSGTLNQSISRISEEVYPG